jgi:hypothetical protein
MAAVGCFALTLAMTHDELFGKPDEWSISLCIGLIVVQENALKFFRPYRFMVAPLTQGSTNLGGSITDRVFELCAGTTMLAWGLIVYLKTGDVRTAVIMPMPDDPDAVETFRGFLANDNEQINLMIGQYQLDPGRWEVNPNRRMVTWNKDYDAWPLSLK